MNDIHNLVHRILSEGDGTGALYSLLSELKQAGDPDAVIRFCKEALRLFPRDIRIRYLLAEACAETGRLSLGEAEIERATEEIEKLVPAYRLKAEIYLRGKRPDDARKSLEIYLAHRSDDPEAAALQEELKAFSTPPAPAPIPEAAAEPEPPPVPPFVPDIATPTLAEVYFGQGQVQEAIATYQRFLAQNPQAERSRQRLAELQALVSPPPSEATGTQPDPTLQKRERMIAVLEAWRSRLCESPHER
ncbi:MAG: tetratricopeptide repeat protein [Thermodesulfobacteriota bacterium]